MLSQSQKGDLLDALFSYEIDGEVSDFDGDSALQGIFMFMREALDQNREKYLATCEKNRKNARKRWESKQTDATAYDRIQTDASASDGVRSGAKHADNDTDNEYDTDNDIDNDTDNDYDNENVSEYGIPQVGTIEIFVSRLRPDLSQKKIIDLTAKCEDAMVRYVEAHDEPIESWRAFVKTICKGGVTD